jgi:hypothetical protein
LGGHLRSPDLQIQDDGFRQDGFRSDGASDGESRSSEQDYANSHDQKAETALEQRFRLTMAYLFHLFEGGHTPLIEDGSDQDQKAGEGAFN